MSKTKGISINASNIKTVEKKSAGKGINQDQGVLDLSIEMDTEVGGIGMGVLSDGTPYL